MEQLLLISGFVGDVVEHENFFLVVSLDNQLILFFLWQVHTLCESVFGTLWFQPNHNFDLLLTIDSTVSTHL